MVVPSGLRTADTTSPLPRAAKTLRLCASTLPGGELVGMIHAPAVPCTGASRAGGYGSSAYPSSVPSAVSDTLAGEVFCGMFHRLTVPPATTPMVPGLRGPEHCTDPYATIWPSALAASDVSCPGILGAFSGLSPAGFPLA